MNFENWILCKELISRIKSMDVPFPTNVGLKEAKLLNAIDCALQSIGTNWDGFEAAFRRALGGR